MKASRWLLVSVGLGIITLPMIALYDHYSASETSVCADTPQNPKEREDWWRAIHGGSIDPVKYREAVRFAERQIRAQRDKLTRDAGINGWTELGPSNIGGRVRGLAIDPNNPDEIFMGGVFGGIWRSIDGGASWNVMTPAPLSHSITSIVIDSTNTSVMYASTGEVRGSGTSPGVGVLKSIDGGITWSTLPDTFSLWLSKVILNPLNTDILYAVGSDDDINYGAGGAEGMVYRSNNAGMSWDTILIDSSSNLIFDIEINPVDTSELIVGTDSGAWISTNSGQSWSSLTGSSPLITTIPNGSGERCELAYCPTDPDIIYAQRFLTEISSDTTVTVDTAHTELWMTSDGGASWNMLFNTSTPDDAGAGASDVNILLTQGNYDNAVWVDPEDCARVVLGGIDLWKYDSGTLTRISNWLDDIDGNVLGGNNSIHADQHIILPHPDYGSGNSTVFIGNDGGVYKAVDIWAATENGGWTSLVTNMNITQLYALDVSLTGDTLVAGAQDNSYFVAHNANSGDLTWSIYSTGDGGHCAINKSNPDIIFSSKQRGTLFRSVDGGNTFCRLRNLGDSITFIDCPDHTIVDDDPVFIAPIEMDPNNYNIIYMGGQRLWQSMDDGSTWSVIYNDTTVARAINTIEITQGNSNIIWIGHTNGTIEKTTGGGGTCDSCWTKVDTSASLNLPDVIVTDIAIHPTNPDRVMVVLGGGISSNRIFYTDDGGVSWSNRDLPVPNQLYAVTWHPGMDSWVYVGTMTGVYASEDNGDNWNITPFYKMNEGPVFSNVLELVWQGDGSEDHPYYLVAATHGRGAWRTSAPIRDKYYVDKFCNPCGLGSFDRPYRTFREAVDAAGSGSEIVFLREGDYNEVPPDLLVDRRIKITLQPSVQDSVVVRVDRSCLAEGITFTTQAQIDSFPGDYPGCVEILGYVRVDQVSSNAIFNLDSLNVLIRIAGDLEIRTNNALTDISGLSNLRSVGGNLEVESNGILPSLSGLENVASVGGTLRIRDNFQLLSIPLHSLKSIGADCHVRNCDMLSSLTGFESLKVIKGELFLQSNNSLSSISALKALYFIGDRLWIENNDALPNLDGLDNIAKVPGDTKISGNLVLSTLQGLGNLAHVGGRLEIISNTNLTSLQGLGALDSVIMELTISANNSLVNVNGLENLRYVGGMTRIINNNSLSHLDGLNGLTCLANTLLIQNNFALISLDGLSSLTELGYDLIIEDNASLPDLDGLQGLSQISHSLKITNNASLSNLQGLDNIDTVDYRLTLEDNASLNDLTAFSSLTYIGNILDVINCDALPDLEGLENLVTIGNGIQIEFNDGLTSLDGLQGLMTIPGFVEIMWNASLSDCTGLDNVSNCGGNLLVENNATLSTLQGLHNLDTIGGSFRIWNNPQLSSLSAISDLDTIGFDLDIRRNNSLQHLTGLENITRLYDLAIYDNDGLLNCSGLDNLASLIGTCEISYNDNLANFAGLEGLNHVRELDLRGNTSVTDFTGFTGLVLVDQQCYIIGHTNATSLSGLDSLSFVGSLMRIGNNDMLTDLSGLSVLDSVDGSLHIYDNDQLLNFNGWDSLEYVQSLEIYNNNSLQSLNGFEQLIHVDGALEIYNNPALTSLNALQNLGMIDSWLHITNNDALPSLAGIGNIDYTTIGQLIIQNSGMLSDCAVQSVCDYIANSGGSLTISTNASGCNTVAEVETDCNN